ncbi:MAG: AmmeMemoRadiSam system protein B, partial [bacterium]
YLSKSAQLRGIIVPMGSIYSVGGIIAHAYKNLYGRNYDLVFILGTSPVKTERILLPESGFLSTPVGNIPVSSSIVNHLLKTSPNLFTISDTGFSTEPSIGTQLPFIQHIFGAQNVVPMLIPDDNESVHFLLAELLATMSKTYNMLIISPVEFYEKNEGSSRFDEIVALFDKCEIESIINRIRSGELLMRGKGGVIALLAFLRGDKGIKIKVLRYVNTRDISLETSKQGAYLMSAVVYKGEEIKDYNESCVEIDSREVIDYARQALYAIFSKKMPESCVEHPHLRAKYRVAVSLYKGNQLRGFSYYQKKDRSLCDVIPELVKLSALADIRYPPLIENELDSLRIEVSLMGSFKPIENPFDFKLGEEGLYVVMGLKEGLLLPQVCSKEGCTKREFVEETCKKADLPMNCYIDRRAKFYSFGVKVISE